MVIPTRRHGSSAVAHAATTKPGELGHKTRACPDGEAHGARAWQYSNHELIDFTGGGHWSGSQKRDTTQQRACLRVMPSGAAVIFDSLVGHDIIGADWQARQDKHRKVAGLTGVQLAAWEEKTGPARHHDLTPFGLCSLIRDSCLPARMSGSRVEGSANRLSAAQGSLILSARWRRSTRCTPPWCACPMWLARGGTSVQDKGPARRRGEWTSRR